MDQRSKRPRDVMGLGLAALNKFASVGLIDRLNLRKPAEHAVYQASRTGFRAVGAANRAFTSVRGRGAPERPAPAAERGLFDLTPTDEQKMIVEATREFAAEQLRPAAAGADSECAAPAEILKRAVTELGMTQLAVPEALGGMGGERSATTGVLVNEELRGDVELVARAATPDELLRMIDAVFTAREQMLEFNVPPQLALESMMVALRLPGGRR